MTARTQLKWPIPRSSWEHHEKRTIDRYGTKRLYAGIEAERIAQLWLTLEETDATPRAGHMGGSLHRNEKKQSATPLANQEKVEVHRDFNRETKERLSVHAKRYDVNKGVLLGYILREYYETDGWGYGIEAAEANDRGVPDDDEAKIPYHESDKIEWLCDRIEPNTDGSIHGKDIRELVEEIGAASRVDHYLNAVLDQLGYVHHPETHRLYIPKRDLSDHGLSIDDPAIKRKPYEALTRDEKIEGIETLLRERSKALSVGEIHDRFFDGNGSTSHVRDLVHQLAESDGFTYRERPSGTKVLRATSEGTNDAQAGLETTQSTLEDASETRQQRIEMLTAIDQQGIDDLNREEQAAKVHLGVTRAARQKQRNIAESGVSDIQKLFDGMIDEETANQLMYAATDAVGFDILDGFTGEKLRVNRTEIDPAIQAVASSPPGVMPESESASKERSDTTSGSESESEPGTDTDEGDDEIDRHDESGETNDQADEAGEIDAEAVRGHPNIIEHAMTDGGTADDNSGGDGDPI